MFKIEKINFLSDLHERNIISNHYGALKYSFINSCFRQPNKHQIIKNKKKQVTVVIAFPKFLSPVFQNEDNIKIKRIIQKKLDSYGIIIEENIENADSYIKAHLSYSFISNIKRLKKRLEICFPIKYKMYFGHIIEDEYHFIIDSLFKLQSKRINHKKIINNLAHKYDNYRKIVFPLINDKKASLFVVFNNDLPIGITLNFHVEKVFFGTLTSFDMDYSKFGIGNLLIYKQLDWCIENDYEYFDMGNGDFEYKKRWSNHKYALETHIISAKNKFLANSISYMLLLKVKLKNILKMVNVDTFLNKFKTYNNIKTSSKDPLYSFEYLSFLAKENTVNEISLENTQYFYIRKIVYDFLYSKKENIDNIKVYTIKNEENSFIIKGENNIAKCVLEKTSF